MSLVHCVALLTTTAKSFRLLMFKFTNRLTRRQRNTLKTNLIRSF